MLDIVAVMAVVLLVLKQGAHLDVAVGVLRALASHHPVELPVPWVAADLLGDVRPAVAITVLPAVAPLPVERSP